MGMRRPVAYYTPLHRDLNLIDAVVRDVCDPVHNRTSRSRNPVHCGSHPNPVYRTSWSRKLVRPGPILGPDASVGL